MKRAFRMLIGILPLTIISVLLSCSDSINTGNANVVVTIANAPKISDGTDMNFEFDSLGSSNDYESNTKYSSGRTYSTSLPAGEYNLEVTYSIAGSTYEGRSGNFTVSQSGITSVSVTSFTPSSGGNTDVSEGSGGIAGESDPAPESDNTCLVNLTLPDKMSLFPGNTLNIPEGTQFAVTCTDLLSNKRVASMNALQGETIGLNLPYTVSELDGKSVVFSRYAVTATAIIDSLNFTTGSTTIVIQGEPGNITYAAKISPVAIVSESDMGTLIIALPKAPNDGVWDSGKLSVTISTLFNGRTEVTSAEHIWSERPEGVYFENMNFSLPKGLNYTVTLNGEANSHSYSGVQTINSFDGSSSPLEIEMK